MLKNSNQNTVVHMHSGNEILPDLKVRFTDEEFQMMLRDGIIQKIENERYEFTELGEQIIHEHI